LEHLSSLMHFQGMGVDAGGAVFPRLPGAPPVAGEVEVIGHLPGQLVHRDAEGVGQGDGGGEDGLLVASLVASELSEADAGVPVDPSAIAFLCAVEAEPVVDFETKRPRADENGERCTWCS
jgi:hypothetical protein